jgi:NAD+ synthase (glutamine-hydrolysing)
LDNIIKIGGASLNQTPIDWKGNLDNIIKAIEQARSEKVEILCLPELAITGYGCEDLFLSSWLPEKALDILKEIIPVCKDILVIAGLPVRYENHVYNCACAIRDKKILGFYAKQFLANEGIHYEPRWFTAWEPGVVKELNVNDEKIPIGDVQFSINNIKIGFEICEDAWRETERPAIRLKEKGVQLILNPSASHFSMGKTRQRIDLINDSSKNFNCTYVYVNLLGNEAGRIIYDGEILIAQNGRMVRSNPRLSFSNTNLLVADINFTHPDATPIKSTKIDSTINEEFIAAASLGLFDYLRKSRNKGFVLSLSGGADSSCCAILIAEMVRRGTEELGNEQFLKKLERADLISKVIHLTPDQSVKFIINQILSCAYQGSENSSDETLASARLLAESIGAKFYHWKISDESLSYTQKIENVLNRKLDWVNDDIALQNIQARARSPIIWMLANINQSILVTTSNRSEGDVGYATMDGDTSGSLAPIAAVDKHFLRNWLVWAENELGYPALANVNRLIPTAELRPSGKSQTDEKDLMPYQILVEIERLGIRDKKSPVEVYHILKNQNTLTETVLKDYIKKFFRLWSANQWKRERTAPAFHLDDFNIDPRTWCRFPILSGSFQEELKLLDEI